ncbi:DUN1 DNA damage response protein kinase DUN1 [Candida maltosa Xu316]|uniref:DNA damage response protein kinase DUN1 n=1 Tax=Candida maltosa (strain Xu316) TaxID=1245528 RepID=M3HKI6_CANMX|nr:DNA damage response protein kinase DUN1 [Candida maltosa Xu316]
MSLVRKRKLSEEETPNKKQAQATTTTTSTHIIARLYTTKETGSNLDIPRKPVIYIGRSSSCDVRIDGIDVSSKHCKLNLIQTTDTGNAYLSITDVSSNGLKINDEYLGKGSSSILKTGDVVTFAKTGGRFIFRYVKDEKEKKKKEGGAKSFFDDYILGRQLGSGHYAVVKEAKDKKTGGTVAVKIFHPNKTGSTSSSSRTEEMKLKQEMELLLSINHPNIVKFVGHYIEPINDHSVNTYLVLEKMNSGELFQRIINKSKLRVDETKAFFRQILSGLQYLHEHDIIHRDIKPENILLDITPKTDKFQKSTGPWDDNEYDVRVKIADFGLAKFIGELKFTNTLCGTPAYVAPEILKNDSRKYTTKVDLWSSGVLLYVCLCGFPPFSDELGPPNMREQILQGQYAFYSPYWDEISDVVLDLISNLLVVNPSERFNVEQTLNHFWFNEKEPEKDELPSEDSQFAEDSYGSSSQPSQLKRLMLRSNTQPMTLKEQYVSSLHVATSS